MRLKVKHGKRDIDIYVPGFHPIIMLRLFVLAWRASKDELAMHRLAAQWQQDPNRTVKVRTKKAGE